MLQLAYAANLVLMIPIAIPTLTRLFPTDQGCFEESSGWRIIVGGFWTSIMLLSILGLRAPLTYSPVLLLQLIYKTLWLVFLRSASNSTRSGKKYSLGNRRIVLVYRLSMAVDHSMDVSAGKVVTVTTPYNAQIGK